MLTTDDLPDLFGHVLKEPYKAPKVHRCPTCHAGFAPVGATARIAAQRQAADRDYREAWARIVAAHPEAVALVVEAAIVEAATRRRPSIDAVWLAVRGKVPKEVSNNNLRSAAARWLMATVEGLAGRFVVRERGGQVHERGER